MSVNGRWDWAAVGPGERTGSAGAGDQRQFDFKSAQSRPAPQPRIASVVSQDPQAHLESRRTVRRCWLRERIRLGVGAMRRGVIDFHQRPAGEDAGLDRDGLVRRIGRALFGVHQQVQTYLFDLALDSRDLGGLRAQLRLVAQTEHAPLRFAESSETGHQPVQIHALGRGLILAREGYQAPHDFRGAIGFRG